MNKLLTILENNARLNNSQLASMLGVTEAEVAAQIEQFERAGILRGYKALVDWDKTDRDLCTARIELKVTPKSGMGFDELAYRVAQYDEVETVYLMSGGYDLAVTVQAKTFKDVSLFVSNRLAPLESVVSTATHFVLRKYKERGVLIGDVEKDTREVTRL